jgi:hypothetical protein
VANIQTTFDNKVSTLELCTTSAQLRTPAESGMGLRGHHQNGKHSSRPVAIWSPRCGVSLPASSALCSSESLRVRDRWLTFVCIHDRYVVLLGG